MNPRERAVALLTRLHASLPRAVNLLIGLAYPLHPDRIREVLPLWSFVARHYLTGAGDPDRFPPVEQALRRPDGLLAVGHLSSARLIEAYRHGIYPWCHVGPMKWWAPAQRMVLFPEETHLSKTLRYTLRQRQLQVTFDQDFVGVVRACAEPRPQRLPVTWISPRVIRAYGRLHGEGIAHSVEVRNGAGDLVGGLYGIASGGIFFAESMFSRTGDASKVALVTLSRHLIEWGFTLLDCKSYTPHHASMGARLISRSEFMQHVVAARDLPRVPAPWSVDPHLDVAGWRPGARPRPGSPAGARSGRGEEAALASAASGRSPAPAQP